MALTKVNTAMVSSGGGDVASNTALGASSLNSNTTGASNVAVGQQALNGNTTASNNTAVGYQAGYTNSTGGSNVFMGYQAGYAATDNNTTAIGFSALKAVTSAYQNTAVGSNAGVAATGDNGTFIGQSAGSAITTGRCNTILGRYTGNQGGLDIRTSSNNIVLSDGDGNPRYYFDAASGDWILNQVSAGYYSQIRFKNSGGQYFAVGTTSTTTPNFQIFNPSGGGVYLTYTGSSWTGVSDERLKDITGEINNGLNKVNQLRAVEFTWKSDETKESQVGLIAQDVQKVLPQAVSENEGHLGVRYTEVIPLLVAAIKEQQAQIEELNAKVEAQAVEIQALKGSK